MLLDSKNNSDLLDKLENISSKKRRPSKGEMLYDFSYLNKLQEDELFKLWLIYKEENLEDYE